MNALAFKRLLFLLLVLGLSGCAGHPARSATDATSRDLDSDRVLVTLDAGSGIGITALSPSGRLDYSSPIAQQLRTAQLQTARRIAAELDLRIEEDWPIPALGVHCFVFRLADAARPRDDVIVRLRTHPDVDSVQPLQFFHGEATGHAGGDPLAGWNEELNRKLIAVHRGSTGKAVKIAVVDAGVDVAHEDLQGSALRAVDFVDGGLEVPAEAHGTAIVGLLSARPDNGLGIRGYAPDAEVLLIRACWETEGNRENTVCNSFTLAKALSLALESDADIVNLSISGPRDPLLERLADELVRRGQLLIAAGADAQTFPASVTNSIVAARHAHAETGQTLTLLPHNRYGLRNGTSIMTAKVTAAAALMKELAPDISAEDFERLLHSQPAAAPAAFTEIASLLAPPSDSIP